MPSVSRQGDSVLSPDGTGYKCRMPMQTSIAGANGNGVFANGMLIAVIGSAITVHPTPNLIAFLKSEKTTLTITNH